MNAIRRRLRVYLALFLSVMVLGVAGFMALEKLSLADALYFSIVTMATVGYGDIHPTTTAGKGLALFLIVMGVGTFLGVVANATELMLVRREERSRLEKLNMVIGAFFSEVGTPLLRLFARAHPGSEALHEALKAPDAWSEADFARLRAQMRQTEYQVELGRVDLDDLAAFLVGKRDFLVRLLENPALLEHQAFTDVLWAVFHLTEELACRTDRAALPETDRHHLAGDAARAYRALALQWLDYMEHLKGRYPYLFSLAVRTNPFDEAASPLVRS